VRILYLAGSSFPIRQARGIQIANTVAALAERGHSITLVVGGTGGPGLGESFAQYGLAPPAGVRLVRLPALRTPTVPGSRWTSLASTAWTVTHLAALRLALPGMASRGVFDAAFARTLRVSASVLDAPLTRDIPLFSEVHFLDSLNSEQSRGSAARRTRALCRLERRVFSSAAGVSTVSGPGRALLVDRYRLAPDSVAVIPNGTRSVQLAGPPVGRDPRLIVYAGQLQDWKGVSTLVDSLRGVPTARLDVIGGLAPLDRPDQSRDRLQRRAREVGVQDRLRLVGPLPYDASLARLRVAAVGVIPLRDTPEGRLFTSPLKMFDYMWAETPIVASDLPSVRDGLVHEHNALLARPEDPDALAAALRRLLRSPDFARDLARQAAADVLQFTWNRRAERLERFFEERARAAGVRRGAGMTRKSGLAG
jgi:glycosyltransferase involved in cell wall biosynthesis